MNNQTAQLLEQHFDAAFAAPDGIAKLRELILTLAMQGKLVEQDPNDPPASELLKEIEAEKRRLVKAGKIKQPKPLPPIKPEEVPYQLPQGWEWVRLGMVAEVNGGFAFKSSKYSYDGVRVIRISDFDEKGFKDDKVVRYPYSDDLSSFSLESNNILMAMTGGTVGKSLLVKSLPEPMVVNQRVATIKMIKGVIPEFINGLIRTNLIQSVIQAAKNSTNDNISMGDITGFFVPHPPLPEQHRIVVRIDQLMARCDELEKLRKERETQRLAVHAAAIKQLLDAPDGSAWDFIQQHFGELYTVKENVAELHKAILQLAVMGRLVPQDPNDPPASVLLKEIEAEKQRLVKAGKIKQPKPLPPIKPEEMSYELPQGWEWVRFEDVVDIGSGITKGRKLEGRKVHSIPYLRVANVQRGYLDLSEIKEIEIPVEESGKYQLASGDLLITEGGDWDKVGRTCIWRGEIPLCGHQNHVFRARKLLGCQNEVWLERYLNSSTARDYFASASKQTTNLASINKTQLRGCPIPLPPLPEQHRIVARIDLLMALCDRLEQQIDAATGKQTELLGAVMAQV